MKITKYIANTSILLVAVLVCSCTTTFKLPLKAEKMEKMFLLKYSTWGHHSLAFYKDGELIEYTYGDWELFALNKRDAWTAWKNMTFPTQGALGRKSIPISGGDDICDQFVGCEKVVPFYAPLTRVDALFNKLQNDYFSRIETEIYNSREEIYFVKFDQPYWGFHNCNHQLVEWLKFLGSEVEGRVFYKPLLIEGMKPKQETIQAF